MPSVSLVWTMSTMRWRRQKYNFFLKSKCFTAPVCNLWKDRGSRVCDSRCSDGHHPETSSGPHPLSQTWQQQPWLNVAFDQPPAINISRGGHQSVLFLSRRVGKALFKYYFSVDFRLRSPEFLLSYLTSLGVEDGMEVLHDLGLSNNQVCVNQKR